MKQIAQALANPQAKTNPWRRFHDPLKSNSKEKNDNRDMSLPMPIIVKQGRDNSPTESLQFDMELSASWKSFSRLSSVEHSEECPLQSYSHSVVRLGENYLTLETELQKKVMQAFTLLKASCCFKNKIDLDLLCDKLMQFGFIAKLVDQQQLKKPNSCVEFAHTISYRFILIYGENERNGDLPMKDPTPCILDPSFKMQFVIQHPSLSYTSMMNSLPEAFVGSIKRLENLVRILCREMSKSFHESRLPLPPWRVYNAMIHRWLHVVQANQKDIETEYFNEPVIVGSS